MKFCFKIIFIVLFISALHHTLKADDNTGEQKIESIFEVDIDTAVNKQRMAFEVDNLGDVDWVIEDYLTDIFPLISENSIERVIQSKKVQRLDENGNESASSTGVYKVSFEVPVNYLQDSPRILWELNVPEFKSRIYQFFDDKEILIDVWPNVVGTIGTKTYTGNFEAYRLRNYPTYKDPDPKKKDVPAVRPGVDNPLGLFVVHYDENSLRYFHGTNKNHLLRNKSRDLSHGCVRNDNDNIDKMKRFIVKKMVKSSDLTGWVGSKKSMIFNMKEEDKFPVKIIYKTYEIDKDEKGKYITLFKDIYKYNDPKNINTKLNDPKLITLSSKENIINEYKLKFPGTIADGELSVLIDNVLNNPNYYERQYFEDLLGRLSMKD
jgi:hypothetical protein